MKKQQAAAVSPKSKKQFAAYSDPKAKAASKPEETKGKGAPVYKPGKGEVVLNKLDGSPYVAVCGNQRDGSFFKVLTGGDFDAVSAAGRHEPNGVWTVVEHLKKGSTKIDADVAPKEGKKSNVRENFIAVMEDTRNQRTVRVLTNSAEKATYAVMTAYPDGKWQLASQETVTGAKATIDATKIGEAKSGLQLEQKPKVKPSELPFADLSPEPFKFPSAKAWKPRVKKGAWMPKGTDVDAEYDRVIWQLLESGKFTKKEVAFQVARYGVAQGYKWLASVAMGFIDQAMEDMKAAGLKPAVLAEKKS